MKTIWLIGIALFTFFCSFGQAKQDNGKKKENTDSQYKQDRSSASDNGPGFDSPQYNNNQAGDGHTEEDGQGDSGEGDEAGEEKGRVTEGISGAPEEDNTQLLGDDNRKAKRSRDSQTNDNYRNNEVSGNPNNTTISDGSNRKAGPPESAENSQAVPSGSQQQSVQGSSTNDQQNTSDTGTTPGAGNAQENSNQAGSATSGTGNTNDAASRGNTAGSSSQGANAPSVIQSSSTQSGSPATPSIEGTNKDGTNNVQEAKPNMAGSDVSGIKSNGRNVDEDHVIRKGTTQQQTNPDPALAEQQQNQGGQNVNGKTTPSNTNAAPVNTSGTSQKQRTSDQRQGSQVRDEEDHTVGGAQQAEGAQSSEQMPDVKAMDTQADLVTEKDREEKKKEKKSRKKRNRKDRD